MTATASSPVTLIEWAPAVIAAAGVVTCVAVVTNLRRDIRKEVQQEANWKGRMDQFKESTTQTLETVKQQLAMILGHLGYPIISQMSPLRLTDFGETLSTALDAKAWAERLVSRVSKNVEGKAEYEIQEYCFDYVKRFTCTDDELALLKKVAYDHGLSEEQIRRVLAIELRDKLLTLAGLKAPE